jgi:hypothetical protein
MLMSVPLTMILKILMENSDDFRWLAMLLDARAPDDQAGAPLAAGQSSR